MLGSYFLRRIHSFCWVFLFDSCFFGCSFELHVFKTATISARTYCHSVAHHRIRIIFMGIVISIIGLTTIYVITTIIFPIIVIPCIISMFVIINSTTTFICLLLFDDPIHMCTCVATCLVRRFGSFPDKTFTSAALVLCPVSCAHPKAVICSSSCF